MGLSRALFPLPHVEPAEGPAAQPAARKGAHCSTDSSGPARRLGFFTVHLCLLLLLAPKQEQNKTADAPLSQFWYCTTERE